MTDKNIKTIPVVSPVISAGFRWYTRRYLRKHFHAVRVAGTERLKSIPSDNAILCYINHPSWWDPLLAVLLTESFLAPRQFYAPIDSEALNKYRVFKRLGFYGLENESASGAKHFLNTTRALLSQSVSAVWITPSGKFQDAREPTHFEPGLSHLAASLQPKDSSSRVTLLPIAFEYPFWQERTPEALIQIGTPIPSTELCDRDKSECHDLLSSALQEAQSELAEKAIRQDSTDFETLLDGTVGVGGLYDLLRRTFAAFRGQPFDAGHAKRYEAESTS